MLLENLKLFLRIADKGGIAAAGRELGLSPATTSERLAALEGHYGVRLFNRSTRAISLTEEGRDLLDGARRLVADSQVLEDRLKRGVDSIAGPIRLSAPLDLGRARLRAALDTFLDDHPDVTVDLHLSDGYADIAAAGFDLAIRYGDLKDSSLIVRKLADNARILCASPGYLDRYGAPEHPDDLAAHDCLLMRFGEDTDRFWPFRVDGTVRRYAVTGRRTANDGGLVRTWCLEGRGIARKSEWDIVGDLASGRLIPLLRDFEPPAVGLQVVFPKGRSHVRRVRALLEALQSEFRKG
ncbi:LysR family transcriptional regulator [Roseibium sediminicola]|uniref:LysR family transcriptional regulator n=1 Tax=Roseibium sediminicola TaxID=2933272 RepID=A0ABT0GUD3_9HYPH|nr:LysR family transcriptional regulator [Roseibium sp. CAU 1639]MCK7613044.1 LysR family transcriptional regulator [Roseibium sp. CAU 1639]